MFNEIKNYSLRRYLVVWANVTLILLVLGTALNFYADPLMFRVFDEGYDKYHVFNERISKVAYYRHEEKEIGCLVFGSSRTTFLDARSLKGWGCANYSFSGATAMEILVYLEYLKERGVKPKTIVIGMDDFHPKRDMAVKLDSVPEFVINHDSIGNPLRYYVSTNSFLFSFDTLMGKESSPNYYDAHMRKYIGFPMRSVGKKYNDEFYLTNAEEGEYALQLYMEFFEQFPDARWIGYVPPISQWARLKLADSGIRNRYVQVLSKYQGLFDEFYDFTFLTSDCDEVYQTNDGVHFTSVIYDRVAQAIIGKSPQFLLTEGHMGSEGELLNELYQGKSKYLLPPLCKLEELESTS